MREDIGKSSRGTFEIGLVVWVRRVSLSLLFFYHVFYFFYFPLLLPFLVWFFSFCNPAFYSHCSFSLQLFTPICTQQTQIHLFILSWARNLRIGRMTKIREERGSTRLASVVPSRRHNENLEVLDKFKIKSSKQRS